MLVASVSYRLKPPSSGFCFPVHSLFPLIYLVIGFSTGSFFRSEQFQISQSSFDFDSLSLSLSLSACVSIFLSVKYSLFPSKCFGTKKCICTSKWTLPKAVQINGLVDLIITKFRWTYADQSVKICYRSKYSDLVSPSPPKSRK